MTTEMETLKADDRSRTGDLLLGKQMLYQLSYVRAISIVTESGRSLISRTRDGSGSSYSRVS